MKDDNLVVTGLHAVFGALENSPKRVLAVYFEENAREDGKKADIRERAETLGIAVESRSNRFFRDRSMGRNAQGVAALLREFPYRDLEDVIDALDTRALVLVCDGVTDPQNLGAIVRSAAFFGADCVIIPRDRSADITPLAERISAGGTGAIPMVQVTNLARALDELRGAGFWVYGTVESDGEALHRAKFDGRTAIVVGAEGSGMRRLTRKKCDVLLTLPSAGKVPALNVSVFAGLMLYEVRRQHEQADLRQEG